ncbi:MAG: SIR2 family protein [Candidatus Thiodiazotropha taylori]
MRFVCDGPNIPDLLLERRDQGRVVFLCGAGVSLKAGMPTFVELTKHVLKSVDPPKDSQLSISFQPWIEGYDGPKIPLDQIFHMLHQEYGKNDVNALVAERLQQKGGSVNISKEHSIIARISSDQMGNPQIVTTNFDLLFEKNLEEGQGRIYEPPALPDISLGVPLSGITYLHGRLKKIEETRHPYVLSSADFGRAYLSEGWATNFIRSLLDSYTVVLVGYQAEDPPVKYLLQGLNHDGMSDRSNLYAFEKGEFEEIEASWRDRGVTPIAYRDHPDLWKSLEEWANRADDPRKWRAKIIDLSMGGPRHISACERGQVAHLVRTTPGARLFASAVPSPPAEWLCVFDVSCRVADKSRGYGEDAEVFDPLEVYGLDDDPPRPTDSGQGVRLTHDNILQWRRGDENPTAFHRIGGRQVAGFEDMPPRLLHLSNWIAKQLDSPAAAWWALRQYGLHPRLMIAIRRTLRQKVDLHPKGRRTWNFILEHHSDNRHFFLDDGWYDLKHSIKIEGWTRSILREFEIVSKPRLTHTLPHGVEASKPPFNDWEETNLSELTKWELKFLNRHGLKINIPDEVLIPVFQIAESQLHRAADLLEDIDGIYFSKITCYPSREIEGEVRGLDANFQWFLGLFERMIASNPKIIRAYANIWQSDNTHYYFRKLNLFALNHKEVFSGDESAKAVLSLNQDYFWDIELRRELLFLLQDRWSEFSKDNKDALINRLLSGPDKQDHWEDNYEVKKFEYASRYTRWLTLQGCEISTKQEKRLDGMIFNLSQWNDGWASSLVTEHYGRSGWVSIDESADSLLELPVNKVVEQAKADLQRQPGSFIDKHSFAGLVKDHPLMALTALAHSAKEGDYTHELWSMLIDSWPEKTKPRLFCLFLNRLQQLPSDTIWSMRHTIGKWIKNRFQSAYEFNQELAWKVFDYLLSALVTGGNETTVSGIVEAQFDDETMTQSRRTHEQAINGPIGDITDGLLITLNSLKLVEGYGIPDDFKTRIESLLASPGEGRDHAVSILTHDISWLYYLDNDWVMSRIIPWFSFSSDEAEPAWSGYLWGINSISPAIRVVLKPYMLELFPKIYFWSWDEYPARIATQLVVELAVFRNDETDGFNNNESRQCLRNMEDKNRRDAVFYLGLIGKQKENGWSTHVIPFIKNIWPKERRFRTSSLVSAWVSILGDSGEVFPSVLSTIRKYLVPVEGRRLELHNFSRGFDGEQPLTVKFPAAVLELLDAVVSNNTGNLPFELEQILELVVESDSSLVSDRRYLRLINLIEHK